MRARAGRSAHVICTSDLCHKAHGHLRALQGMGLLYSALDKPAQAVKFAQACVFADSRLRCPHAPCSLAVKALHKGVVKWGFAVSRANELMYHRQACDILIQHQQYKDVARVICPLALKKDAERVGTRTAVE